MRHLHRCMLVKEPHLLSVFSFGHRTISISSISRQVKDSKPNWKPLMMNSGPMDTLSLVHVFSMTYDRVITQVER